MMGELKYKLAWNNKYKYLGLLLKVLGPVILRQFVVNCHSNEQQEKKSETNQFLWRPFVFLFCFKSSTLDN